MRNTSGKELVINGDKRSAWALSLGLRVFCTLITFCSLSSFALANRVPLSGLSLEQIHQDWGKPGADKSVDGHPLSIGGRLFEHGVGTHAYSVWQIDLKGNGERFSALVGVDDEVKSDPSAGKIALRFKVYGDHTLLFNSGWIQTGDAAKQISVDVRGIKTLILLVEPKGSSINFAHADWADAAIEYQGEIPVSIEPALEPREVLTPKPSATPRINGAKIFGVRPGHPVLFTIATTGDRPMSFTAKGLPAGLSLDSATGRLNGSVSQQGETVVKLTATNARGTNTRNLRIVVGDTIALTPPMGWNSWNCFATAVSDDKIRAAADAMVARGLIDHGWTYINIDDCWEVRANEPDYKRRDEEGRINTNSRFPDMKALADYIHSKGLRAGLYSSPGPATCGGYTASYQFQEQDARQYASWGFDYLKYDWCTYGDIADQLGKRPNPPSDLEILQHPYNIMRDALVRQNRDIVFSLCQYGMGNVWEWGRRVGGNCWRTTGDIVDSWGVMSGIGFNQDKCQLFTGPGHWNDPDMLVVGDVGWGPSLHPTHLTSNEQYTHITLWSLLSAPLLIGCDMTKLDDFTLGLLTNDEVNAVDQDPLGKPAVRYHQDGQDTEVWTKELDDGSKAVGMFNRGDVPVTVTARWVELGLSSRQSVRDLWRQKDLGNFDNEFSATIGRHGAMMIKVSEPPGK